MGIVRNVKKLVWEKTYEERKKSKVLPEEEEK